MRKTEGLEPHEVQPTKLRIRNEFKQNKSEQDAQKIETLMKSTCSRVTVHLQTTAGQSKLAFLATISAKKPNEFSTGAAVYTIKEGHVVEGRASQEIKDTVNDLRITDEQLNRHYKLLRRQHFMDRE
jgi:hypothetical protein